MATLEASSSPDIAKIFQEASDTIGHLSNLSAEDSRKKALAAARSLVAQLERPEDAIMRYIWETGSQRMALRVAVDLRVFRLLEEHGGSLSAAEIAVKANAEEQFIVRIMRVLVAMGFVVEDGIQHYATNPITKAMTKDPLEAAVKIVYDLSGQVLTRMPQYLSENGYKCPTDPKSCPFQWAMKTDLTYFQYLQTNVTRRKDFDIFMSGNRINRRHWVDWFPVANEILSDLSSDFILVDVGGNRGHDLKRFLKEFPQCSDRLVLQDLPAVVDSATDLSGIQVMAYDFFDPQPIKGARVYYTHFVLHDWPDHRCQEILRNLKEAMRPGYSKILLNESILPDQGCPAFFAAGDLNFMSVFGGKKRSRAEWVALIESVDLHVSKIWESPDAEDDEGIIEATLKASS